MKVKDIYNHRKWERKEKLDTKKFSIERNIYKLLGKKSKAKEYIGLELNSLWIIFGRLVKAILYLLCMFLVSICIDKMFLYFGWKEVILDYIRYDREIFVNFLISTISIAGFLIALFYANLSGIFTTRYAHISSRISRELLNEHTNKRYFNAIQNYIIVVLLVLILNIIGRDTGIILAILFVILSIRIIIIFIELSKRIFMYSDIAIIANTSAQKINENIDNVLVSHYKYDNPSFQNHHNNLVMENINTINDLADSLIKDSDFDGLNKLLNKNLCLIAKYTRVKNKIPFDSLWFPNKSRAKVWFKESDHVLITAINTGTSLMPELIKDIYFFENKLFEVNMKIISHLFKEQQLKNIYSYFEQYHQFISIFSESGDIDYWYKNIQKNTNFIMENIEGIKDYKNEYIIGLIDMVSLFQIDFLLDFNEKFINLLKEVQNIKLEEINVKSSLKHNYHFMNNENFHEFIKKLENERYVEGKLVTSEKFIQEFVYSRISEEIRKFIMYMPITMIELQKISKQMFEKKWLVASALISSRIIELYNKINNHIYTFEENYNYLYEFKNGNFEFKKIDFDNIRKEVKTNNISNVEDFSKIAMGLYLEKYDIEHNQLDFIGQAYYQLTFVMLQLIFDNDYESFERLYSKFFALCSISDSYIREIIPNTYNPSYVANKYAMTTINFMNISGFAMYYSHLISDARWEQLVLNYTDELLSKGQVKEKWITICKTCAEVNENNILGVSLLGTSIKTSIQRFISDNNLIKFKSLGGFYGEIVDSEDELIQKFRYSDMSFSYEFYEIYLYFCINTHCNDGSKYKTRNNWTERKVKNV